MEPLGTPGHAVPSRGCPSTILRMVPLPVSGRNYAVSAATSALTFFCRHCGSGATSQ